MRNGDMASLIQNSNTVVNRQLHRDNIFFYHSFAYSFGHNVDTNAVLSLPLFDNMRIEKTTIVDGSFFFQVKRHRTNESLLIQRER